MTKAALDELLILLQREIRLPAGSISFEIQADGHFLLVSIPADALSQPSNPALGKHITSLMDHVVPRRPDEDSWMVVFTQGDKVLDSFSGGNLASPTLSL